jgi:hypothetical protein
MLTTDEAQRFVNRPSLPLIDDLVRRHQQCCGTTSPSAFSLKIDDEFYIVRLLDGNIGRTRALENFVDGYRGIPPSFRKVSNQCSRAKGTEPEISMIRR